MLMAGWLAVLTTIITELVALVIFGAKVYHISMIYLYIGKNSIKLLALSKSILGQYNVSYFLKLHENDLLSEGKVKDVDILASAIKEALTLATPKEIIDKQVFLILPQDSFEFRGYNVPSDISPTAIAPFIKEKTRADISFDLEDAIHDYFLGKQGEESKVLFYAQKHDIYKGFQDSLRILGLNIVSVLPETLAFYKLFEKTLKKDKKENILYVSYSKSDPYGFIFNSLGLYKEEKYDFEDEVEPSIKITIEKLLKENIKVDRIILSGELSEKVRQDHFTKNVGVWTNPLKKIISTFYREYLKLIIVPPEYSLSFLDFDVCIGAFIFDRENGFFAASDKPRISTRAKSISMPKFNFAFLSKGQDEIQEKAPTGEDVKTNAPEDEKPKIINRRDIIVFIISFILSFSIIFFFPKLANKFGGAKTVNLNMPKIANPLKKPSPTEKPTSTPTPTPSFKKETLKIMVLNGSGTAGKAGEMRDILKEKGYSEILTGNAASFDFKNTEIQVKDDQKGAADSVIKDLATEVKITKVTSLKKDSASDLTLIVGDDFK